MLSATCVYVYAMQPIVPDAAADSLGISPHKDAGFLTVLVQDSTPGLQVCGTYSGSFCNSAWGPTDLIGST